MKWTPRSRVKKNGRAVVKAGTGPRVLLIHGVGLRAEAWNAQITALSDRFEILAPDLPGHGESECLPGTPTLQDYSNFVASLLEQPALVAGHSMGAMIALDLARRYSDQVRGVVAMNAIYKRTAAAKAAVRKRAETLSIHAAIDPKETLLRWFGDEASPERSACDMWLRSVDPAGYKAAYTVFAEEDGPSDGDLKSLNCPALFMTGAKERNSTPEMTRAMASLVPASAARVIETAAHMLPMTHPDDVNDAMTDFSEREMS